MKKKVLLVVLLLLAVAALTATGVQADFGGPGMWYDVDIVGAYQHGIYLSRATHCAHPCNFYNSSRTGYALHVGYGDTYQECRNSAAASQRDDMTYTPRFEPWVVGDPDGRLLRSPGIAKVTLQGAQPGQTACIFWCCQPIPPLMIFQWEYATVIEDY